MSDTYGIYVAGFNDGYRVAHIGCIENIYDIGLLSPAGKKRIRELFSGSIVYTVRALALEAGHDLADVCEDLGRGVVCLGYLGEFYTDEPTGDIGSKMSAEEVLKGFMKHFHVAPEGGLEWSYRQGMSVQLVVGLYYFEELSRYLDDKVLEDLKNFSQ